MSKRSTLHCRTPCLLAPSMWCGLNGSSPAPVNVVLWGRSYVRHLSVLYVYDSAVDSTDNDCLMSKRSTLRCCTPCLLCGLNGSSPAIFQAMIMFISIMMACPATMPASMLWSVRLCNIFTSRALSYQFLACNQPSSCHRFDTHSLPTALLLITPVFNIFMYGTHVWWCVLTLTQMLAGLHSKRWLWFWFAVTYYRYVQVCTACETVVLMLPRLKSTQRWKLIKVSS